MKECTFFLCESVGRDGDEFRWEIEGTSPTYFESPYTMAKGHGSDPNHYFKVTVQPGQYILNVDEGEVGEESAVSLYRAPFDKEKFEDFCLKAEKIASQSVYDRLMGYKRGPRFGGGPYIYDEDFSGRWLEEFLVKEWKTDDEIRRSQLPTCLQDAIEEYQDDITAQTS